MTESSNEQQNTECRISNGEEIEAVQQITEEQNNEPL